MAAERPDRPVVPGLPPGLRHDLLNALNAVLGYATFLVEDLPDGPQRDFALRLQRAGEEAQRLAELLPRTPRRSRAVLMLSPSPQADSLLLQLDALGFDGLRLSTSAELVRTLAAAPASWLAVLLDPGPVPPDIANAAAAAGKPLLHRREGEDAAGLAARLEQLGEG
ncbi:hypothetical protein [Oleisolibacter albus]|uniref:hypothetical protein n=1 Tax=Oleisolibacter albus TaxID=2171757 RepID=UPI0012D820E9|nr:hypothetical protein [Oleisolibacter albus]